MEFEATRLNNWVISSDVYQDGSSNANIKIDSVLSCNRFTISRFTEVFPTIQSSYHSINKSIYI